MSTYIQNQCSVCIKWCCDTDILQIASTSLCAKCIFFKKLNMKLQENQMKAVYKWQICFLYILMVSKCYYSSIYVYFIQNFELEPWGISNQW